MLKNNYKVLVIGAALTGISTVKELCLMGNTVILNDKRTKEELKESIESLKDFNIEFVFGSHPIELAERCDILILSPGVSIDLPLVQKALKLGKEVISEVELAYRYIKAPIMAITGTNGKTTTTSLLGEIMKESGRKTFITGNIGNPMIADIRSSGEEDIFVLEVSSFQLESTNTFKPKVSAILNISSDHMDRHKTLENYIAEKSKIFINQDKNDYTILNKDDKITSSLSALSKARVLMFSRKHKLSEGAFIQDGYLVVSIGEKKERIIKVDDIYIPGLHNLENALAASLMAVCMNVDSDIISSVLKTFKGVEHRLEYVCRIDGVDYYNDSKGTNVDSSIRALEAIEKPIILIAGGYNKGSDFYDFIKAFKFKVKALVLLGDTAEKIEKQAHELGFIDTYKAKDLEEAVKKSNSIAVSGDVVLLSPACASWDMFKSFEERGRLFKSIVKGLRGNS